MTTAAGRHPVQNALTLVVKAKSPEHYAGLVRTVKALQEAPPDQNPVARALNTIRTVHFARFVFLDGERLAVITTFDGSFDTYILDFVAELHAVFDRLLSFVEGWPEGRSVQDHPDEFVAFVRERDLPSEGQLYSAYPDRSVMSIAPRPPQADREQRLAEPQPLPRERQVPPTLADVQRLVLKGYHSSDALHIGLTVRDAVEARAFLGRVAAPGTGPGSLTTADEWHLTEGVCLTVGLTFAGLRALGVPERQLATFPVEFCEGAVARAPVVGDVGPSSPSGWLPWLRDGELHILLSLQSAEHPKDVTGRAEVDAAAQALAVGWAAGCRELDRFAAAALPITEAQLRARPVAASGNGGGRATRDMLVHFGYRDGFSQPTIRDLPLIGLKDPLEDVPVGALVLGQDLPDTGSDGLPYRHPLPGGPALGRNGSFAAFRVLEQDVDAFEAFLNEQSAETGQSKELIAAKLCGRWREGSPLTLRPDEASPPVSDDIANDFDYAGGGAEAGEGDPTGLRCPLGSHIRRMNPRSTPVAGAPSVQNLRRLVRRGMPYGPPYDEGKPRDGVPRGLVGLFIGASIRDSFEFMMREWANDGAFSATLGRTQDPLLGGHDQPGTDVFAVPGEPERTLSGLRRFVTTRGGAYLFLPSAGALQHLADTPPEGPGAAVALKKRLQQLPPASAGPAAQATSQRPQDPQLAYLVGEFLTRRGPLVRELLAEGGVLATPTALVVSGYDAVREVLETPDVFGTAPYARAMSTINDGAPFVLGMDPGAEFDRDRALLEEVLTSGGADSAREQVGREAAALLGVPGPVDVVAYARAVAARVVEERLGVKGLTAEELVACCHDVFLGLFVNLQQDPVLEQRAVAARRLLRERIDGQVGEARASGARPEDVLGLLTASVDGASLTEARVTDQVIGLVVGLVDNVVAGICSALDELLRRPDALRLAESAAQREDDVLARIVAEVLRFAPPAPLLLRETSREHLLRGIRVPAHTPVLALTAAAMVDPRAFPRPEEVRVDRPWEDYLHFGAGAHRCPGRSLGLTTVVEAIRALVLAGASGGVVEPPGLQRHGDTPVRYVLHLPAPG